MEAGLTPVLQAQRFHAALRQLDWTRPWWREWATVGQRVAQRCLSGASLVDALNTEPQMPVLAVPQGELPEGVGYESFIGAARACPTREGLHDFFNALCWIHLPQTKWRMNALHCGEQSAHAPGAPRGPVRDALTVLDENGGLLHAPPELWTALRQHAWTRACLDLRALWGQARWLPLGHALLEKLAQPRKDICAHLWAEPMPALPLSEVDGWLAEQLQPERLRQKPFSPLPVLGVPGWCPDNEGPGFYADERVFRPRRRS